MAQPLTGLRVKVASVDPGGFGHMRDGRVRTTLEESRVDGDRLYSRWRPWPDVEVETWLIPHPPWHLRAVHPPGEHWLACAVLATTDRTQWTEAW